MIKQNLSFRSLTWFFTAILVLGSLNTFTATAQVAQADPEALGLSAQRLSRLDAAVQSYIEQEQIAGAVTLIRRRGQTAQLKSYGMMDIEAGKPMPTDAIFRIASMSKAVTTTAVMILYEEGKLLLSDPVHKYIPEFKDPVVAVENTGGDGYSLIPATQQITIHHLLTHTSGLGYGYGIARDRYEEAGLTGWYFADKKEPIGQVIKRLAGLPLDFNPGERWGYGYSTDVLGYLVEVVSGMPLDEFFRTRIFEPLNMADTHFFLPPEKAGRLAPVYGLEEGKLKLMEPTNTTDYIHGPQTCFSGGAGLLSTIEDYGRFLQMLLNGGELEGVRLLSPKTVELMRADHLGDTYGGPGVGFGLGFWVVNDLGLYGKLGSTGSYGWGSAYYPEYWIDPGEEMIGIMMTQLRPAGGIDLREKFRSTVYQAVID